MAIRDNLRARLKQNKNNSLNKGTDIGKNSLLKRKPPFKQIKIRGDFSYIKSKTREKMHSDCYFVKGKYPIILQTSLGNNNTRNVRNKKINNTLNSEDTFNTLNHRNKNINKNNSSFTKQILTRSLGNLNIKNIENIKIIKKDKSLIKEKMRMTLEKMNGFNDTDDINDIKNENVLNLMSELNTRDKEILCLKGKIVELLGINSELKYENAELKEENERLRFCVEKMKECLLKNLRKDISDGDVRQDKKGESDVKTLNDNNLTREDKSRIFVSNKTKDNLHVENSEEKTREKIYKMSDINKSKVCSLGNKINDNNSKLIYDNHSHITLDPDEI